jgi:hypothetical protein
METKLTYTADEIEQIIENSRQEILNAEFKEDLIKETSYLICMVQQYCRKGGTKDLW